MFSIHKKCIYPLIDLKGVQFALIVSLLIMKEEQFHLEMVVITVLFLVEVVGCLPSYGCICEPSKAVGASVCNERCCLKRIF